MIHLNVFNICMEPPFALISDLQCFRLDSIKVSLYCIYIEYSGTGRRISHADKSQPVRLAVAGKYRYLDGGKSSHLSVSIFVEGLELEYIHLGYGVLSRARQWRRRTLVVWQRAIEQPSSIDDWLADSIGSDSQGTCWGPRRANWQYCRQLTVVLTCINRLTHWRRVRYSAAALQGKNYIGFQVHAFSYLLTALRTYN